MPHDHPSASPKAHLDDLLTTIGLRREQLAEMTAEDLFAAATQWQQTATTAAAPVKYLRHPVDRLPVEPDSVASI